MLEEASLDRYLASPLGKYFAGSCYFHVCEPGACATVVWGSPDLSEAAEFVKVVDVELSDAVPPHVALVDLSQLRALSASVYEPVARYVASVQEKSRNKVLRRALIFGSGLAGSIAAGIYPVVGNEIPYRGFTDPLAAAAWLELGQDTVRRWLALRDARMQLAAMQADLRSWLAAHGPAGAEKIARALGMSPRSMQRRLKEAGTSFQLELDRHRLSTATDRLASSDAKIAAIATEVGFKTANQFSAWFKKQTGVSPAAYRASSAS